MKRRVYPLEVDIIVHEKIPQSQRMDGERCSIVLETHPPLPPPISFHFFTVGCT